MKGLLKALFTERCYLCDGALMEGAGLCRGCLDDLPGLGRGCSHCAIPLSSSAQRLCGRCQSRLPAYDKVYGLFEYHEPVSSLIAELKFRHRFPVARLLGALLAGKLAERLSHRPDYILPVPLHSGRIRWRGFNQSVELARPVGGLLRLPVLLNTVVRARPTQSQRELRARERMHNLRGAFELQARPVGHYVLIIDDVMTTGATVNEIARLLKRSGVRRVEVAVIARAVRD